MFTIVPNDNELVSLTPHPTAHHPRNYLHAPPTDSLDNNLHQGDLQKCEKTVFLFQQCTAAVEPLGLGGQVKNALFKNRFLSAPDEFGRENSVIKQGLEKMAPTLFDEDERAPSRITETLQQVMPRFFTDGDDDDDDE